MLNELSNDPIQRAIARLEKQHEEDKQVNAKSSLLLLSISFTTVLALKNILVCVSDFIYFFLFFFVFLCFFNKLNI